MNRKSNNTNIVKAWHFVGAEGTLRYRHDGRIARLGRWLKYKRQPYYEKSIKMCSSGMHASRDMFDAMWYARTFGAILCRVELKGQRIYGEDKICAEYRKVLWKVDINPLFFEIAAMICPRRWMWVEDKKGRLRKRRGSKDCNWALAYPGRPIEALRCAFDERRYNKTKTKNIIARALVAARRKHKRKSNAKFAIAA